MEIPKNLFRTLIAAKTDAQLARFLQAHVRPGPPLPAELKRWRVERDQMRSAWERLDSIETRVQAAHVWRKEEMPSDKRIPEHVKAVMRTRREAHDRDQEFFVVAVLINRGLARNVPVE